MTSDFHDPASYGVFGPLDEEQCWTLLQTTSLGRVAFATPEGLTLVPVNFVLHEQAIFVRVDGASVLGALAGPCDDVAFEVDFHDDLFQTGWSVMLHATSDLATPEEAEAAYAASNRLGPWAPGERTTVVKLTPDRVSGRRVARR